MERQQAIRPLPNLAFAPQAIGRYLVDLPEGVRLLGWSQAFQGTGSIMTAEGITPDQFKTIVEQRAAELRAVTHDEGGTLLEKIVSLNLPHAKAVVYWDSEFCVKERLIECDAFYLLNGRLYKFKITMYLDPVEQAEHFRGFESMLRSIQPRRPEEIPTAPGSCFDHSFLHDGPDRDFREIIMVSAVWPDRPDVQFQFYIFCNGTYVDPPLLTRLAQRRRLDEPGVLRCGSRKVDAHDGEEILERITHANGTEGHLFIWEAQGEANSLEQPQVRIDMSTGIGKDGSQNASLDDKDALALWDRIVGSWRWRPTR